MDKERAKRIASNSARQAMARRAQRQAAVDASVARKKLAEQGVGKDQYKYYREMDIDSEQKRLEDLQRKQEVFKGFETLVGSGGTLDTPIYDGDTPIYFKDYFSDYDQSLDLSTMEGRKQAITPYDYSSEIYKLGKSLDIARLAQSVNLDAKADFSQFSAPNDQATKALQKERRDSYMTPEEKNRYYYLYNTQGAKAAESYMRALQNDLYSRGMKKVEDFVGDNWAVGSVAPIGSVLTSLLSGIEGVANMASYAADKYIGLNENAEMRRGYLSDVTQALRGGVSKDYSDTGKFFYNTALSGVDSFVASLIPGGHLLLGASAASQATNDILTRGGTDDQALIGGVAAGIFESFFEKYSIEALDSMQLDEITTSFKAFAKNIGKQVLTNAQEEMATEAANIVFDTVAMGDISNYALMVGQYMDEGMSESEAIAKAAGQFGLQIAEAGASGALIGGAFGVGGAGVGALARAKQGRSIVNDSGTRLNDLIEAGEATFAGDKYKGERELLEAVKANKSKNDVAQRNRVQKLDELLTKEAAERAKTAPSWAEQQKAIREAALKDVTGAVDKARGEAENAKIGKDITYTHMPSIANFSGAEGGNIYVEKSDGATAKLSDLAVEDEELYEAYSLATSTGSVENANAFVQNYRLHGNNVPVEEFWTAWMGAQNYGQTVMSEGAMEKAVAKYGASNIPEAALQAAFLSGRKLRSSASEKFKADQAKYEKAWKEAGGKVIASKFDDSALRGKSLDNTQQEYRSFLRVFSRATGTNIEVFASEKGARKENGSYNRDSNTLRIDINAGISNKANYNAMHSSLINTLSHETVHNMRVTASEQYEKLRDFVTEKLQEDEGYNLDEAIEAEIEKYKQKGEDITREDAIEEIVARACEDRLGSSEALRDFLIDFYAKDKDAANGFIKAVREFIARLKTFFENIAKQKSNAEEARLIAEKGADIVAELQKLFDEAVLAMREGNTARNAVAAAGISIDTASQSASPVMLSEATWRESEYVTKKEQAAIALATALNVSESDALKYINNVNSIAKMIANDRARLDYFASSFGSAFVSNVEYGGSFDFTTLCKKRRVYTGTFSEIQKRLGEVALTPDQILEIRNLLIAARYEAPCGLCYVEGSRANMGKFAKKFIELYKRDNPGAWIPKMVDVNTPDGVEQMHRMHPECYEQYEYFWNHYGKLRDSDPALFASQQKPKLYEARKAYKNEILELFKTDANVANKNRNGGIRMQSFSDFEIVHAIDTMQIIMDMSRVGLAGQAYTKVPEFAKAFGDTGLKINLSLIAKGVDENGKIIFDDREGMPHETAFDIRKKHSKNVGTILVIFNDAQLYAAMADDRIDFIIPFHRSQWKKGQYAAMGLPAGTKDYTYMQNEKLIKPTYHEYQGRMVKDKATNYMPNAYWDFNKSGKENAENYLDMCAKNNKRPKFYKLLDYDGNGRYSLKADGSTDGYWKLLVDFKMYDNEGNGSPQNAVRPDFSMTEIRKMLKEYEGGHTSYPVAHDVVDEFVDKYKAQETAKSSSLLTQPVKVGAAVGGTMFQERDEQFQTEYEQQVDNVMNGVYKGDDVVMIGRTPEALTKIGVNQLPLTITPAHIYSIAKTEAEAKAEGRYDKRFNYHGLGTDAVKQIGKKLSSPLMVLTHQEFTESQQKNHVSEHRVVVVVELEINGRQVICPIEIDADIKIGTNRYDVNHITTYFDKKAFNELIGEAIAKETIGEVGFYYIKNEKKAHEILQGSGYQLPQQLASRYASEDIIRHIDTNVNRKIENFLGSKQFIRWFGDWMNDPMRASKIVDDNGVPMVVYHGTNTDFSIFDINKSSNTTKRYIDGFYFTTEQKVAKKIADLVSKSRGGDSNVLAVYLDVKKPLVLTAGEYQKIGFDDKWRNEVLNKLTKGKHDGVIIKPERERVEGVFADSYNYDADANVYYNAEKYGITDKDYAWWLNRAVSNPDFTATQIAVFKPEQVKSATDNIGTYDKGNSNMFYQDRIETPDPSEVLRQYFSGNTTYEAYKPYVESLNKYRDLMERVEVLGKGSRLLTTR